MLPGMEHQAGVQVRPRVSQGLTTLENDMVDSVATELPRRCQTRRAGANHDGVIVGWRRNADKGEGRRHKGEVFCFLASIPSSPFCLLPSPLAGEVFIGLLERFQVLHQCPAILVGADAPPDVVTRVG